MLSSTLKEKGYEVVDIAKIAESWSKPVAESTIEGEKGGAESYLVLF